MNAKENKPSFSATVAWIFYDFANTAYSMNVVSLYFPVWIINELGQSDFWVSLVNSISMALVALTMPVLGDWSDRKSKKILALFLFTLVCILGTFSFGVAGKSISSLSLLIPVVLIIYIFANYSYQGGLVFYNALLPAVSTPKILGRISGYGVAIGYMGSAAGLLVGGLFVDGSKFGLTIPGIEAGGTVAAFMPTALLFLVFALPIFVFVREPQLKAGKDHWDIKSSYKKVWSSITSTKKHPGLLRFLVAKYLYEDSIHTIIIFMGVYTQAVMGFSSEETNNFFIIVIPAAVVGSIICGVLTDHFGPKKTLVGVIFTWVVVLSLTILTMNRTVFWFLGGSVGILLGSTWTAARPLLITLVPKENIGEFFGLYALSGKAAAITGPLIWSTVTLSFARYGAIFKYKAAIGALVLVMIGGLLILWRVPDLHRSHKYEEK
ncbi:MFS transporter [candidate division KSB1 bacterium]|nr:MFS transporter [candidate division KSB1 bacterium]RQW04151.1 MAG: MFS transporter [candidate division KSB1 bacterium]